MREDRPIYASQVTCRLTSDLVNRVDNIAESKMLSRGGWMRNAILEMVRKEELNPHPVVQSPVI
jgi:predicted transcriptional regulator